MVLGPFGEAKLLMSEMRLRNWTWKSLFPIFAAGAGPGVLPPAPRASCASSCQYEIMFQLQDQTDWFNSYHESIFLHYHALTLRLMYQTPKEKVSAWRALSERNTPGAGGRQRQMQMKEELGGAFGFHLGSLCSFVFLA